MAGTSLLALLDDIATILDDVAAMTKVAAKKTAGVLGDDLALNAEQVSGVNADRELPVVWAVAKGSLRNKLILVPAALAVSAMLPWVVTPLLMLGGLYLCFEGCEKLAHHLLHGREEQAEHAARLQALHDPQVDLVAWEAEKIKGAVRTDFILSAEIIVIALGTVQGAALATRVAVVSGIALLMTVGVYALVAAIVKLDDFGLYLAADRQGRRAGALSLAVGRALLLLAPRLMKGLAAVGTAAMFLVGGGILVHGFPAGHHLVEAAVAAAGRAGAGGALLQALAPTVVNLAAGIAAGALALTAVVTAQRVTGRCTSPRR